MRTLPSIALLLIFTLFTGVCRARENEQIDSLLRDYNSQTNDSAKINTLLGLFNAYLYSDPQKAKHYAEEQLQLAVKSGNTRGKALGIYNIGVYYSNTNQTDSSRKYYLQALAIYNKLKLLNEKGRTLHGLAILEYAAGNYPAALELLDSTIYIYSELITDSVQLAGEYHLKGWIHSMQGYYQLSLQEILKAVKLYEQGNDKIRLADAYNGLAAAEATLENFEKAIEYNLLALEIYRDNNDKVYQAQALNDIGNAYFYLEDYLKAKDYLEKSLPLARETGSQDLEATALLNLGKTYRKLSQFELAQSNLEQSLSLIRNSGSLPKYLEILVEQGRVANDMKKPHIAMGYFNKAIPASDSMGYKQNLRAAYFNRSKAFEQLNDFRNALTDHKAFTRISDSIYSESKSRQIEELRTMYDMQRKEQEIELQKQKIALLDQKSHIDRLQKTGLYTGIIFLILLIGLGAYGHKQRMKRNQLEREKLDTELEFKRKELITNALLLARKNETLEELKQKAQNIHDSGNSNQHYQQLIHSINLDLQDDKNWNNFMRYFEETHKDFNTNITSLYPGITAGELRLMALIKMNLSSKEMASILNISIPGIKKARQRLRKKLNLQPTDSLETTIMDIG